MSRRIPWMLATILSVIALAAVDVWADPPGLKTLAIGAKAPDFDLPGVDGKNYSLKDFADKRLLAIIFTCNHCPTAQAYESRIIRLQSDYQEKGVALVAISPNSAEAVRLDELGYTDLGDSLEDMKLRAKEREFKFPYLYDGDTQKTAQAYGVIATPQVYLFDQDRILRYVGRIDDSEVKEVTTHDTRNAIDALLAGKPVPVEKTRVFGCSTKWAEKVEDAKKSLQKWEAESVTLEQLDEATLKNLVKNETDKLLLVNVWMTTCGPCLQEMPDFVMINRMYRNRDFKMVTISIDEPEGKATALRLLTERHVSTTNYITSLNHDKFADILDKQWEGPLPYTVLIAPGGKVVYRKQGPIVPLELRRAIVEVLGRTYASREKK